MDIADALDPSDMDADELRAEVWFWREAAASKLSGLLKDIVAARADNVNLPEAAAQAGVWASLLEGALSQDELIKCFACSEVLVPGQPAIRDVNEGDAHADCMGEHIDGDRYQLAPESICDDRDEPIPGHDGVLRSHPYAPLRTTAQMAELLSRAEAALAAEA